MINYTILFFDLRIENLLFSSNILINSIVAIKKAGEESCPFPARRFQRITFFFLKICRQIIVDRTGKNDTGISASTDADNQCQYENFGRTSTKKSVKQIR